MKVNHLLLFSVVLLTLQGCKTAERKPPPMPPTASPPTSSPPPSTPARESESKSSPAKPSTSSTSKSSPPSAPSEPSQSSSPSQRSSPSTPSPSSQAKPASSSEQARQEAAENLKKAGQRIAEAGTQLPGEPGEAGGEPDPLMPDGPESKSAEGAVADASGNPGQEASGETGETSDTSGDPGQETSAEPGQMSEPDDMMMEEEPAGTSGSGNLSEEILAAQEALEQASIAMQTAGEALEKASSSEELAEAEADLARARVSVIVAGQDLLEIQDILEGSPEAMVIGEAQEALNDANVAIVVATDSIFSSRIELPEFERQEGSGAARGGESELDKELNDSIVVFENTILDARNDVMGTTPAPTASENIPGVAVLGGSGDIPSGDGTFEENQGDLITDDEADIMQQGRMPEDAEVAAVDTEGQSRIPEDAPDPQGDDIVAQQLREAAIAEKDPELRDKLWDEYKRYKAGL